MNKASIIVALIFALTFCLLGGFYFFTERGKRQQAKEYTEMVEKTRADCLSQAKIEAENRIAKATADVASEYEADRIRGIRTELINLLYRDCLVSRGLKAEDVYKLE